MKAPIAAVVGAIVAVLAGAAPEPAPVATDLRLPGVRERLASLRPDDATAYFELAEEIASEFPDEPGRRRAQELFVLALDIDRRAGERTCRLERSVHRALGALTDNPFERRWLTLMGESAGPSSFAADDAQTLIAGAADAAQALSAFRAADALEVRRMLERPGAREALGAAAREVSALAPIVARMEDVGACPTCRNRLILKPAIGPDVPLQICPTCRGNPGPGLSATEFMATLRAEDLLLEPRHSRWSAEVFLSGGAPIAEEGTRDLARHFQVDVAKPYFHPVAGAADPLAGLWSDRPSDAPR